MLGRALPSLAALMLALPMAAAAGCADQPAGGEPPRLAGDTSPPTVAPADLPPDAPVTAPTTTAPVPSPVAAPPTPPPTTAPPAPQPDLSAYSGLGTWVDVYDWSHYRGATPTVGVADIDEMARQGVQTLFLQTAKHDTPDDISEPELLLPLIERARARGLRVIAWYLPTLTDPALDLRRLLASARLPVDGLAVDIESRDVADPAERSRRLIELSAALRRALPGQVLGAIVMPPVQIEVVNPAYWPNFPYREIAPFYDVWLTMGYWTFRSGEHRDAERYTAENLRRLRNNLGQPDAPVHPIGGIGDRSTAADLEGFHRAAVAGRAVGASVYDYRTTAPGHWPVLRRLRAA